MRCARPEPWTSWRRGSMPPERPPLAVLKLGGALLTDKAGREALRPDVLARLAAELAAWPPTHRGGLVVGHGSGSFAHVAVRESGFLERPRDRLALARVAAAAARLGGKVVAALIEAGLPAVGIPGAALARWRGGRLIGVRETLVAPLLAAGVVPVTWGDAAIDDAGQNAIAETEVLLAALARQLGAVRLVAATDVDGVFERDPASDPAQRPRARLTRAVLGALALGGAREGTADVTGGMASKVANLLDLVESMPGLEVRIVSGLRPGAVAAALEGADGAGGTVVAAD